MKNNFQHLFLLSIIIILSACNKHQTNQIPVVSEQDKETLTYLKEVEWPKAYAEQDTILLDSILGEDFIMIDQDGNWYSKQDELDWIKEHEFAVDTFWYEIKSLKIYKNGTAIICGTGHISQDTINSIYESSNVLVKEGGLWKAVLSHVSGTKIIP